MKNILKLEKDADRILKCLDTYTTLCFRLVLENGNLVERIITKIHTTDVLYSHIKHVYKPKKNIKISDVYHVSYNDLIKIEKEVESSKSGNTIKGLIVELLSMGYSPFY